MCSNRSSILLLLLSVVEYFKKVRVISLSGLQGICWVQKTGLSVRSHFLLFLLEKKKLKCGCVILSHSCLIIYLCTYLSACLSIPHLIYLPTHLLTTCVPVSLGGGRHPGRRPWKRGAHSLAWLQLCPPCRGRCRASPSACLSLSVLTCEMRGLAMTSRVPSHS